MSYKHKAILADATAEVEGKKTARTAPLGGLGEEVVA